MTDADRLRALLRQWDVPFTVASVDEGTEIATGGYASRRDGEEEIPGDEAKVDGYSGFYTCFVFDTEGRFVRMGAWE